MKNFKNFSTSLLASALSLFLCTTMFMGTTFAWFTDSVTSGSNRIQAGTIAVALETLDNDNSKWIAVDNSVKLFDSDKWESGYTEMKLLKVKNEGNLALKWCVKFVSTEELSDLADVIDVYVNNGLRTYPASNTDVNEQSGWIKVGTVKEFVNTIEETPKGSLRPKEEAYLGLALKMREPVDDKYQGKSLGDFNVVIQATQNTISNDP